MRFQFWTTSIKSNVLYQYHDAFSVFDLARNKLLSKNDELSLMENQNVFLLAKGFSSEEYLLAPMILSAVIKFLLNNQSQDDESLLENAFKYTNHEVRKIADSKEYVVYGADLVGLHLKNNEIIISHVGRKGD